MKKILAALALWFPISMMAQSNWEIPNAGNNKQKEVKKEKKAEKQSAQAAYRDPKYTSKDAVTEIDGKVAWEIDIDVPGSTAQQNYDKMLEFLNKLVTEKNQLEKSNVSLVNKQEHKIAASVREWLILSSTFYATDRTKFYYTLFVDCFDNHVKVTMNRINYYYDERPNITTKFTAEELISNDNALNKAKTKLVRPGAKFRRRTIDRKDELFSKIKSYLING